LITPYKEHAAGKIARALVDCREIRNADIAYRSDIDRERILRASQRRSS
jgi:hypothetical protein